MLLLADENHPHHLHQLGLRLLRFRLLFPHLCHVLFGLSGLSRHCRKKLIGLIVAFLALFNPRLRRRRRRHLEPGSSQKRAAGLAQSASVSPDAAKTPDATAPAFVKKV